MIPAGLRYFLHLSFNGKNYHGWQYQKNGRSVQAEINKVLSLLLKSEINVVGCGRTDTGVHAEKFFAHFESHYSPLLSNNQHFIGKLNSFLPQDIVIFRIIQVQPDANARFSAISRTYEYRISLTKNPFTNDLTYPYYGQLDLPLMNQGAKIIMDQTDFTSFSKLHTQVKNNCCIVSDARWEMHNQNIVFSITADRFLRNMVRAIVGTLLDLGKHKINLNDLKTIIDSRDRSKAGMSVPAKGLFLSDVKYPESIFI